MKCLQCGREFKPPSNRLTQKFCSRACYERYRAVFKPRKCACCGRVFTPMNGKLHQMFCSQACREKFQSEKLKKKSKPLELWTKEAAECNLDYGSYRALINAGKTFEELKATSHLRTLPTHAKLQGQHHFTGEKIT